MYPSFCSSMAGANAIHSTKHQKLTAEQNKQDPSKFNYHFLYKALIVAIFLVILPFFPSQAPEFINQSLLTRNWELLHLVFVGIAISYGLFSRRNDDKTEKENHNSKFDNAQSLVSRFLQVSSFFEDDSENSSSESDENKIQSWSNQYYRNEPVLVVAPQTEHSDFDEEEQGAATASSRIREKPLLLPVRSLKSRLSDHGDVQSVNESSNNSVSLNRSASKLGFKRFSSNSNRARNAELEGPGSEKAENVVLPSPIPWRSRSGRMEPHSLPSMEESEFGKIESRSVKSQTSRSTRQGSVPSSPKLTPSSVSSPKELSSSPSFSSESLAKNAEDLMRNKKGFCNCSPPPPPPPPPMFQKSISMKPRYGSLDDGGSFEKELKRSFTSERKDLNMNMSMGKSVRTVRGGQNLASFATGREIGEEVMNGRFETRKLAAEEHFMEEPTRKTVSFRTEKLMGHASVPLVSQPEASMEFAEEEEGKENFLDKVTLESDEETETEDEDIEGRFIHSERGESPPPNGESSKTDGAPPSGNIGGDEGPDVDKKADEFIAKFREQIRLQRIESIKRSTRIPRNSSSSR